jgi:heptosyltransferase-2
LIIKWSALGDVAIATATIQDIADALPHCELHLNTLPPWEQLFANDPRFGELLSVDLRGRERGPAGMLRWLSEVRRRRYDAIFDLQGNDHTRILLGLLWLSGSRVRYRVGYHRRFPYNVAPPAPSSSSAHVFERAGALLAAAGIAPRAKRPVLVVPDEQQRNAAALLEGAGLAENSFAVFLPGCQAAGYLKRWGAARYAALARRLLDGGIDRVVLLGAQDEFEECRKIAAAAGPQVINLCGRTEVLELIPICARARIIVANDTGAAHLVSATGRPMVVVCGPTDPHRVKPLGDNVRALQAPLPCINCYRKHCAHHSCMRLMTPAMVEAELEDLLASG